MKRTTSFHLETDILEMILEYKKEHNLSSRNVALERMLLERRHLLSIICCEEAAHANLEDKLDCMKDYDLCDD